MSTIKDVIEKYGYKQDYVFFAVYNQGTGMKAAIWGHFTDGKFYNYCRNCDKSGGLPTFPISEIKELGVSGAENKYCRGIDVSVERIDELAPDDEYNFLTCGVDFSFKQSECDDGCAINFETGTYVMLGSVKEEVYNVYFTRMGFAQVRGRSFEEAMERAEEYNEGDISWSDEWEIDGEVSE